MTTPIVTSCDACRLPSKGTAIYCDVHGRSKGRRMVELCQTRPDYRLLWDEGPQPRRSPPRTVDPVEWFTARHAAIKACTPLPEVLEALDRCLSSGCSMLIGDVCTDHEGSGCKKREVWFGKLSMGGCCFLRGSCRSCK